MTSEHTEAVVFMRAVRGAEDRWPDLRWLHAVPNGGLRNKRVAAQLKAEGVRPGVPDYLLPVPRGPFVGLALELKRLHGGRVSREQHEWLAHLTSAGWATAVCHGWEAAWASVVDYMGQEPHQSLCAGRPPFECGEGSGTQGRASQARTGRIKRVST
ncbi:nuclease [Pseudoxanthomonas kalamensis DSM 18571]|uniref:VRR-NUC domain-containing protein n=1 Tax=Pseudoxanthomonas kalamensis TaxID=289483 RepID=UPI001391A1F6|nr:VRR-NUC domain-containing protein [Pseudoxanthomonas kalamensis]KAF1711078.1 nuclease [Pseudoxanthomonas kalamensis DSM 18571]